MAFEVPALPYDYGALEPHIDEQTKRLHHDKHHQTYVDKANAALEGTEWADKPVEEVLQNLDKLPDDKRTAVRNNAGGHSNHSFFWQIMSPDGGGEPDGALAEAISDAFGGFDDFKKQVADAGANRRDLDAEPGRANHGGPRASPGDRRLGARLLPQVPKPPARLPRGLVERRQLARRRRALCARDRHGPRRDLRERGRRDCPGGLCHYGTSCGSLQRWRRGSTFPPGWPAARPARAGGPSA